MKLLQKARITVLLVGIVCFSGSIVASTNLFCTIDCEPFWLANNSDTHACCLKHGKAHQSSDALTEKCANCIESAGYSPIISESIPAKKLFVKPPVTSLLSLPAPTGVQLQAPSLEFSLNIARRQVSEPCYIRLRKLVI